MSLFLKGVFCLGIIISIQIDGQRIYLPQGAMIGTQDWFAGKYVYSFRGVQYAEAPVGRFRFQPSQPYNRSWTGTNSAQLGGSPCPQPFYSGNAPMSEDCLHLSVFTSYLPDPRKPVRTSQPVIVYLSGSLFTSNNVDNIHPEDLVSSKNVVVVTVSYRLSVLGFLSMENPVLSGNMGLLDQYYALLWVNQNIRYFGGDPMQVTLIGSGSGGAASALYHTLSPRSQPLISRTVVASGTGLARWSHSDNPKQNGIRFIENIGCVDTSSNLVLACLQGKSVEEILRVLEDLLVGGDSMSLFTPVDDSFLAPSVQFLGGNMAYLLSQGSARIPILVGMNTEDGVDILQHVRRTGRLNTGSEDFSQLVQSTISSSVGFESLSQQIGNITQDIFNYKYFGYTSTYEQNKENLFDSLIRLYTDRDFLVPITETLTRLSESQSPVYFFVNGWRVEDPVTTGSNRSFATSGSFDALLLGSEQSSRLTGRAPSREERELSAVLQDVVMQFVREGNPPLSLGFSRYSTKNPAFVFINNYTAGFNFGDDSISFWTKLIPGMKSMVEGSSSFIEESDGSKSEVDVYSTITWLLLAVVLLLLALLAFLWVNGRRRNSFLDTSMFHMGSGVGDRDRVTHSTANTITSSSFITRSPSRFFRLGTPPRNYTSRRTWRDTITDNKL